MANSPRITAAVANAMLNNSIGTLSGWANSGIIYIYSGTQPASGGGALSGNTLLSSGMTMNATAFGSASAGVITANNITPDSSAAATGTATWFRLTKSDGVTVLLDGSVGVSGCDLNIVTTSIVMGGTVTCTSFTITQPQQ
jgi:hypothetical protein